MLLDAPPPALPPAIAARMHASGGTHHPLTPAITVPGSSQHFSPQPMIPAAQGAVMPAGYDPRNMTSAIGQGATTTGGQYTSAHFDIPNLNPGMPITSMPSGPIAQTPTQQHPLGQVANQGQASILPRARRLTAQDNQAPKKSRKQRKNATASSSRQGTAPPIPRAIAPRPATAVTIHQDNPDIGPLTFQHAASAAQGAAVRVADRAPARPPTLDNMFVPTDLPGRFRAPPGSESVIRFDPAMTLDPEGPLFFDEGNPAAGTQPYSSFFEDEYAAIMREQALTEATMSRPWEMFPAQELPEWDPFLMVMDIEGPSEVAGAAPSGQASAQDQGVLGTSGQVTTTESTSPAPALPVPKLRKKPQAQGVDSAEVMINMRAHLQGNQAPFSAEQLDPMLFSTATEEDRLQPVQPKLNLTEEEAHQIPEKTIKGKNMAWGGCTAVTEHMDFSNDPDLKDLSIFYEDWD